MDPANPSASKGVTEVSVRFSNSAEGAKASDFVIASDSGDAPRVKSVKISGREARLVFSDTLPANTWSTITHKPSQTSIRLARFHGDTDQDGHVDHDDLRYLTDEFNKNGNVPVRTGDVDADTKVDARDIIASIKRVMD